jgi:hypothetical protein
VVVETETTHAVGLFIEDVAVVIGTQDKISITMGSKGKITSMTIEATVKVISKITLIKLKTRVILYHLRTEVLINQE